MAHRGGIISRHVVLPGVHSPVYAVILIEDGFFFDVVLISDSRVTVESLAEKYAEWQPVDYEHCYVSPGLIDVNVQANGSWEGLAYTTRAAVSGGVTFLLLEESLYEQTEDWTTLHCDVGTVEVFDEKRGSDVQSALRPDVFAIKTYLFPPSHCVGSGLSLLPKLLEVAQKSDVPLFVDCSYPAPILLLMASPCRFCSLDERALATTFVEDKFFAGAFPEDLNPHSDTSSGSSPSRLSLQVPLFPRENLQDDGISGANWHLPSRSVEIDEVPLEGPPTLTLTNSTEKLSKRRKSVHLKTIFDDLRSRIEETEQSIEDLSRIEQLAYQQAGKTQYGRKRSFSINGETIKNKSGNNSGTRQAEKRKRPRPLMLSSSVQRESKDCLYIYHLANHPDHWESNGVEKVLELLTDSIAKVHFSNLSSVRAISKLLGQVHKRATVETAHNYLFFTADSISDGDTRLKSSPPIRNKANCNLLWDLLKLGQIDVVASHHQPVAPASKPPSFKQALPGIAGVGFALQSIWTKLCSPAAASHDFYIVRMAKWLSGSPAALLGIQRTRGSISRGKLADFVIWKPEEQTIGRCFGLVPEQSPYHGVSMRGEILRVYVRGQVAFSAGEFHAVGARMQKTKLVCTV